jgi:hypothetical protein
MNAKIDHCTMHRHCCASAAADVHSTLHCVNMHVSAQQQHPYAKTAVALLEGRVFEAGMEGIISSHRSSWDMAATSSMQAEVNNSSSGSVRMHASSLDPGIL